MQNSKMKTRILAVLLAGVALFAACAHNTVRLQTRLPVSGNTPSPSQDTQTSASVTSAATAPEESATASNAPTDASASMPEETASTTPEAPTTPETPETPTTPGPFLPFTMAFTGDISYAETYYSGTRLSHHLGVYNYAMNKGRTLDSLISDDMLERMLAADCLVVNCESSVSDRGESLGAQGKTYTFRTSTETAKMFEKIGADLIGLANNHVYDFGQDAFLDTLDTFAEMGIPTVGAGRNADEAFAPYYYTAPNGMKVAVIATSRAEKHYYTLVAGDDTPGICGCHVEKDNLPVAYGEARVLESIKEAKSNADFVIVYPHFGSEGTTVIEKAQRNAAYSFIDAGADLVIGAHSHCLQGVEAYHGKIIFYSLGNYLFNLKTMSTALLELTFNEKDDVSMRFVTAMQIDGKVVGEIGTKKGKSILADLRKLSPTVDIDEDGYVRIKPENAQ